MTAPAGVFVPHPTMPYGQPGQPGAAPVGGYPGYPGAGPAAPPAAPPAAHPTVPFGDPNAPPAGYQPPAAPQGGYPGGVNPNAVIQAGPGVPPELVGRTFGQAFAIYSALATDYVTRNPAPARAASQAQTEAERQQQHPGQPNGQPLAAQPPRQPGQMSDGAREFFADPDAYMTKREERLIQKFNETMSNNPATQQAQRNQMATAAEQAANQVPDFKALVPFMGPIVENADPASLTDPNNWIAVADIARGRAMRSGQYGQLVAGMQNGQPPAAPPAAPPNAWAAAGGTPGGSVPAAMLPQFAFFTEGPTASTNTATGQPNGQLTPSQAEAAGKFGMSVEQYNAWKGGVKHVR